MQFTDEQLKAIDISRLGEDACIVAGPGSGKTTVLVERIRQVIEAGMDPSEILAITYTEKAAQNMRERLSARFAGDAGVLRKLEHANVSTIHGYCSRVLRENATAAGVDPEFTILDEQRAILEQAHALRETLDALYREKPEEMEALLAATNGADLESQIPSIYEAMRAAGMRPAELDAQPRPAAPSLESVLSAAKRYLLGFAANLNAAQRRRRDQTSEWISAVEKSGSPRQLLEALETRDVFSASVKNSAKESVAFIRTNGRLLQAALLDQAFASEKRLLVEIIERFDAAYAARKSALAALDFSDLEFFTVRLFEESPEVRQQVNDQFRLVMIDEFQDTSGQQSKLISLVRGPGRFYAVGDLNQSIYSFRHASPVVFEEYRKSVEGSGAHLQELVENWRSRAPVLHATQLVLHNQPGITKRDLVAARQLPDCAEPSVEVIIAAGDEESEDHEIEAAWVVDRIAELRASLRLDGDGHAARLSDFAILVRNSNVLKPFLKAFEDAGIAYNLNRRVGFFETREARDLLHLLRMIRNPRDEVSTLVVLRSDLAGISDEGLLRLKRGAQNFGDALAAFGAVTLDPEDTIRLNRFLAAFARWRAAAAQIPLDRVLLRALDEMGVVWDPLTTRGANVEKFLQVARANETMTLGEFVDYVEALRSANPREADSPIDETQDAVQIMTAHAAKGLEFPVVILAAMDKGVGSDGGRSPLLNFTPERGLGVKWSLEDGEESESGAVHHYNKQRNKSTEEAEANRLLYVAMTRAEERLILCWSQEPRGKAAGWAKTVSAAFGLSFPNWSGQPEIQKQTAPDGTTFDVRVLAAAGLPERLRLAEDSPSDRGALVIERPALADQFEPNTTATALANFASCPRKYYLGGFLGWDGHLVRPRPARNGARDGAGISARASEIGTQVHGLLAGVEPEKPDLDAIRLAQVFERSGLGRRAEKAVRREREWDFVFGVDDLIVRGTIDLWFEDAKGLALVDYKTDDVTREHAASRARDYELQLQVYAAALERALGKAPAQASLYFLRPDVVVPVVVTDAAASVRRLAGEFIEAQEKVEFPLRVGAHCRRCEFFRNLCPARLPALPE